MSTELTALYLALLDFIEPLRARLADRDALEYLFYRYGWNATMDDAAFARFRQEATVIAPVEQFTQLAEALRAKLQAGTGPDPGDVEAVAGSAATLIRALAGFGMAGLDGLPDPLSRPDFWDSIAEQIFDDLLERYLRVYQRPIFLVLRLWNVIRYDATSASGPGRVPYTRVWFDWDQAAGMLTDPLQALRQAYHWGDPAQPFDFDGALEALRLAFAALGVPAARFAPAFVPGAIPGDAARSASADLLALRVTLLERDYPGQDAFYRIGFEAYPAARSTDQVPAGLMLRPVLEGGADTTLPLTSLLNFTIATVLSADEAIGLALFPGEAGLVAGAAAVGASLTLETSGTGPWYVFGTAQTSHITVSGFLLRASVEGSTDNPEFRLEARFPGAGGEPGATAVVTLSGADSFVQETVNRDAVTFSFAPDIVWSSKTGLTFSGKTAPTLNLPLSIPLGPISLTDASIELGAVPQSATSARGIALRAGVGVAGTLGPVSFSIAQLGFSCVITPYSRDDVRAVPGTAVPPALGAVDVAVQFAPPTGVGVRIDAGVVTGGGFLTHSGTEYGGSLELAISDVMLKAYGLVQTQLPGRRTGYSLIAVISTEFSPPVELPFGFTLEGVGGLIGINRTIDEDAVRSALWAHHFDGLLFPADPVTAAPQLMAALDSYFPGAPGRYLFGPLAKLGWGGLVDGEVALLLELPEPVKLLLVGEIQALVPSAEPQLRLHVSFAGGIDFGKKLAFFDASLHDSSITTYPISGDLAFRYGWGSGGTLALALGGFNPHFQPPPGFPALKRVAIAIGSSVAQIQAQAYLALTSNTLQFGARAELTAGTGAFNVHGWLGFDVLCQRDPLAFEFDLSAGIDLRHGTDVLASVHLDGTLSGPSPWHISGEASVSLLFFDISVHFDKTWGDQAPQVFAPDPVPAVLAALRDRSGWRGAPGANVRAIVTSAGDPAEAGDAVLLDPAGGLRLTQRALPLSLPVTRVAGTPLGRTVQVTIDDLTVLGAPVTDPTAATEEFAPGQFLDLSDAEQLSLPSFSLMDAGVEVGASATDVGSGTRSRSVATPFEYDTTIDDTQAQRPAPGYVIAETTLLALNASAQAGAGGLGRYAPPPTAAPLIALAPERWVVADTSDLALSADVATDGTKLGAVLALSSYLAAHPSAAGQLQVVLAGEAT